MSDYETYIEIDVNGVKIPVLLDTCDRVLVPRRVVPDADLSPTTVELYAANGSRIDVLGIMRLRFTINHRIMYVYALVSNDIAETIFGFQFLRKYDCKWHFTKNLLQTGSMCVPLKHRRGTANLRRVYVIEKTTVAPSSCVNIPMELPMCNLRVAVWLSGNALASINVVALRQTRLLLGWVTVCGRVRNQPTRPTQPFILTGSINRVPTCPVGVKAGRSPLSGGR